MAEPPPLPAAGAIPPALAKIAIVDLRTGLATILFISFLTQLWARIAGDGGLVPTVEELVEEVAIIFGMHGDGTLSATGVLIVTKTNGVPFGPFATGTDAADLTGTLSPDRIADGTLPYVKLVDTTQAALLGADAAGPVVEITIGAGLSLLVGVLAFDGATVDDGTIPYEKLVDTAGAALLGADAAGPVTQISVGRGLVLATNSLKAQDPIVAVAALGTATAGLRAFVTDSNVVAAGNFGNVVAGGGANFVPVFADGAAWRIG